MNNLHNNAVTGKDTDEFLGPIDVPIYASGGEPVQPEEQDVASEHAGKVNAKEWISTKNAGRNRPEKNEGFEKDAHPPKNQSRRGHGCQTGAILTQS